MKGARVSLKEFAAYLEVPISDILENMFALFDEVRNTIMLQRTKNLLVPFQLGF